MSQPMVAVSWVALAGGLLVMVLLAGACVSLVRGVERLRTQRRYRRDIVDLFAEQLQLARAQRTEREQEADSWSGYRKFRVARKVVEVPRVVSLHLTPHDRKPLPGYRPGQFLTLQLRPAGTARSLVRCYSLSDVPSTDHFRITVKKIPPPESAPSAAPGQASSFLCDVVAEGDLLDVKAPSGNFCVDLARRSPLVLIGGGVGITPLVAMLKAVAERGFDRDVWLFYGDRRSEMLLWLDELDRLAREYPDRLRVYACLSRAVDGELTADDTGIRYHAGRISVDFLRSVLPSNNYTFHVCGPPGMLEQLTHELRAWGVPEARVRVEAFGAASVRSLAPPAVADERFSVTFARTEREVVWESGAGSLLDLALREGIFIDSNCRAGNCGTCCVALEAGEVHYPHAPGELPASGTCLSCVAVPASDVVLDA